VTGHGARDQRGVATVMALCLAVVLLAVAAVSMGTVAIVLAHRRAQVAADLASLAGASAWQSGADPCAAAAAIADRHDATITRCVVDGTSVVVATEVRLPPVLGSHSVPARARAGPQAPTVDGELLPAPGPTPAALP